MCRRMGGDEADDTAWKLKLVLHAASVRKAVMPTSLDDGQSGREDQPEIDSFGGKGALNKVAQDNRTLVRRAEPHSPSLWGEALGSLPSLQQAGMSNISRGKYLARIPSMPSRKTPRQPPPQALGQGCLISDGQVPCGRKSSQPTWHQGVSGDKWEHKRFSQNRKVSNNIAWRAKSSIFVPDIRMSSTQL